MNRIEEIARIACREDGERRMMENGPSYVPCGNYRTWQAYEDANWRRFLNPIAAERAEYERLKEKFERRASDRTDSATTTPASDSPSQSISGPESAA